MSWLAVSGWLLSTAALVASGAFAGWAVWDWRARRRVGDAYAVRCPDCGVRAEFRDIVSRGHWAAGHVDAGHSNLEFDREAGR